MDVFKISVPNGIEVGTFDNTTWKCSENMGYALFSLRTLIRSYLGQLGKKKKKKIIIGYDSAPRVLSAENDPHATSSP